MIIKCLRFYLLFLIEPVCYKYQILLYTIKQVNMIYTEANKEYLTRKEVAQKLRVSYPTLKRWRDKQLISCYKIGFIVRYKVSEIEQLLSESHFKSNTQKNEI